MNPRPKSVKAIDNYRLIITFKNGDEKIFDVSSLLEFKMYEKLKDKSFFSSVKTDGTCVYWNDEIDLCPDLIYEKSFSIGDNK
jgi:hypothetical protein